MYLNLSEKSQEQKALSTSAGIVGEVGINNKKKGELKNMKIYN